MKPIETKWKGWRFRSRTEARWAVFLEAAGIEFEYESEGLVLPSGPYLPDFRLKSFPNWPPPEGETPEDVWLEIKGTTPTDAERLKCFHLACETGNPVLLAVGAPDFSEQVELYERHDSEAIGLLLPQIIGPLAFMEFGTSDFSVLCVGRGPRELEPVPEGDAEGAAFARSFNMFADPFCRVLGVAGVRFNTPDTRVGLGATMRAAYDAARSARFEFGQTDQRWPG